MEIKGYILSERKMVDINQLRYELQAETDIDDISLHILGICAMIADSIKATYINLSYNLNWWNIWVKFSIRKYKKFADPKFSGANWVQKNFSPTELVKAKEYIDQIEGTDKKKEGTAVNH